jgi:hypothetical protein
VNIAKINWVFPEFMGKETRVRKLNSYLPDRSYKGGEVLEELVKYLADDLIIRLEEVEKEADFEFLMSLSDDDISNEAYLLYEEIIKLKTRLQAL